MHTKTKRILLSASLAFCCSVTAWAQSININLSDYLPVGNTDVMELTKNGVRFNYIQNAQTHGASIYRNDTMYGDQSLYITSTEKAITAIEFEGKLSTYNGKTADIVEASGKGDLQINHTGTSTWSGNEMSLHFKGASTSTSYSITTIRIWLEGDDDVNPGGEGGDLGGGDDGKTYEQHYVKAKTLPTDGEAVTMAIVGHTKFRDALAPYIEWKTQQGYNVVDFYADEIKSETGTSGPDLAEAIRQRLMALPQRPSFVLIAGDIEEVPAFKGTVYYRNGEYYTDYHYGEYNGDFFPDAYVGRFSANTVEQLQAQMSKTRHMALLSPEEGKWLSQSLVVQNPASDINIEEEVKWLSTYPKNFAGNSVVVSSAGQNTTINNTINAGSAFVFYTGHAGTNGWGQRLEYSTYYAEQVTNRDRYPVIVANSCYSGTFAGSCIGESFMRKKDAGAVVYVGATREAYNNCHFFTGGNIMGGTYEHIGFLRSLFPTSAQDVSQQSRTIGEAVALGNFGLQGGLSSYYSASVEYFNILGDPTFQPYITVPKRMTITSSAPSEGEEMRVTTGSDFNVVTAPEAVVCISRGRTIVAVALADKEGNAVLRIPAGAATGKCILYSSAPGYNDDFKEIFVTEGDGQKDYADLDIVPEMEIKADAVDIIALDHGLTATYDQWPDDYINSTTSGANYLAKVSADKTGEAFVIRNRYDYCSIVSSKSGGSVRTVKIDWKQPTGEAYRIGVYGSSSPYSQTSDAWPVPQGDLLGTIVRGDNAPLVVTGDYPYVCIRVENFQEAPSQTLEAEILRLEIGWDKGGVRPMGDVTGDKLLAKDDVETMTRMLLHKESITAWSDVDGNGRISIGDITKLVGKLKK